MEKLKWILVGTVYLRAAKYNKTPVFFLTLAVRIVCYVKDVDGTTVPLAISLYTTVQKPQV